MSESETDPVAMDASTTASEPSSPAGNIKKTNLFGSVTPKSTRRLFDDADDGESISELLDQFSPPANPRRYTLRALDPNDRQRQKRNSHPSTPDTAMSTNASEGSSQATIMSPNSFRTMDGRFVQSRNPFSAGSPMMTEDDTKTPRDGSLQGPVPSFPMSFATTTEDTSSQLPPRSRFGFPDPRFGFTGSPVAEDPVQEARTKVRRLSIKDDVGKQRLQVDTKADSSSKLDEVSPTDVMHPFSSSPYRRISKASAAPTPARPSRVRQEEPKSQGSSTSRFSVDFDIIRELGQGSFGKVYQVLSRLDGCMYAIKAGHRPAKGASDRDRMLKEVYALAALSDQADTANFHIVRYHQAWMESDRLYIQTELCQGTLLDEIHQPRPMLEVRRYKLLREMLLALDFIHRNQMVHLDIKPENIFLKNDQFKLGDFGLVSESSASHEVEEGDSRYMSMELLSGDRSNLTKSDIFSLGATMYEICRNEGALPMNGPLWQDLRGDRLHLPLPDTSNELNCLIRRMMQAISTERPTAADLLKHPRLLSEEQKELNRERQKALIAEANLQLAQVPPPHRKRLVRANTWNGNLSVLL